MARASYILIIYRITYIYIKNTRMESLNEQTIKRLQKLAGIHEIRVLNPTEGDLKKLIEPIRGIEAGSPYDVVYDTLMGWIEGYSGMSDDPTGEYTRKINIDFIEDVIEDGDGFPGLIDWVERFNKLGPNLMYVYNNGPYESFKFTTDSEGNLYASAPSGISEDSTLLSRYDDRGNLVPNN